ncbi:UbiA family prenyltransferase [Natrinema thermotolerans]
MDTRTVHTPFLLNLWLCIGAVLMVCITAITLDIPLSAIGVGILLPALGVYVIYVEDRRNISPEDRINNAYRTALVERFDTPLLYTSLASIVIYQAITLFFAIDLASTSRTGLALLIAQLPLVFIYTYDDSKRYPFIDSAYVAVVWAVLIFLPIFLSTTLRVTMPTVAVFMAWFAIIFAGVESRNVNDITGDDEVNRATVASILGPHRTKYLVLSLKTAGLGTIYGLGGVLPALLTVVYLLYLSLFRELTRNITPPPEYRAGEPSNGM